MEPLRVCSHRCEIVGCSDESRHYTPRVVLAELSLRVFYTPQTKSEDRHTQLLHTHTREFQRVKKSLRQRLTHFLKIIINANFLCISVEIVTRHSILEK
jgi:hypothetical protein